jgi:histone chaperone ASF1
VLEEVMVGPVVAGRNKFVLQAEAPNHALIANRDLIGVTVILITCSYMDNRFVQIGYYVNNEYQDQFEPENFPNPVDINKLYRSILAQEPRVTRFAVDWTGGGGIPPIASSSGSSDNNNAEGNPGEAVPGGNEQDEGDLVDLENDEDDEEDDEDDEDEGEDLEVDLEAEDDMEEDEEDDEGEGEGEVEVEGEPSDSDHFVSMEVMNEDSMDVERMLQ